VEEAVDLFEAKPDHPNALGNLGIACMTLGKPCGAIVIFYKLLEGEPGNPSTGST
jgi:hypothetical protein